MKTLGFSATIGLCPALLWTAAVLCDLPHGSSTAFGAAPAPASSGPQAKVGAEQPSPGGETSLPSFPGAALLNDRPPFFAGVKVNHSDLAYHEGETLSVQFTAERDAYLYLLYHQADGKSYLLFPNEAHTANQVAGGHPTSIPPLDQPFRFRISPPFGTEVLQILATVQPAKELDALVQKTGQAAAVSPEILQALIRRLSQDLTAWSEHRVPIRTAAGTAAPQAPSRKAARVGLFVGVNKFEAHKQGEKEDEEPNRRFRLGAELMAQTMLQRGQLDSQRVKVLTGEQATRANVEAAITRWLPSVTEPGDVVFLFYAGHGGLVKNLDGTKPDGKDGVLTTYNNAFQAKKLTEDDWDAEARKNWICDGTLARWLQELPGRQVAVIISSCHSGSMIDARLLAKFGAREAVRVKGISQVNTAIMVSCLPDEETLSDPEKPVWLAQYLADAMAKLPAPVTLQQAYEYYRSQHRQRTMEEGSTGFHEPILTDTALLPIVLVP